MFETVALAPPDPILGLTEAFRKDPHPDKVDLSVGQYQDDSGTTPILDVVKQAERRLLELESSKGYLGIVGHPEFDRLVPRLLFGASHPRLAEQRIATLQTPGGTGALRVAADFLHTILPDTHVWLSNPTWPNHPNIFQAAGLDMSSYAYYDEQRFELDFDALRSALKKIPAGHTVVLHACCHNPTGIDLHSEQWREVAEILRDRQLMPLVDFAYQGLGEGLEEDAAGLRILAEHVDELMVCSSFSKNFGLYCERVGALTVMGSSSDNTAAVISQVKKCVRSNYSNPPAHGAAIVATVLGDTGLREQWHRELAEMRQRIQSLRRTFADTMQMLGSPVDFSFITRQRGMFSFSGLSAQQVEQLRNEHSIYIVRSGRINVAGMTTHNVPRVCRAIMEVIT